MAVAASNTLSANDPRLSTYTTWPNQTWPTYYPTYYLTYTYTMSGEAERLRLALKLVADAGSLSEAKRIAKTALRIADESE